MGATVLHYVVIKLFLKEISFNFFTISSSILILSINSRKILPSQPSMIGNTPKIERMS
jgi:hypothetical protein